MTDNANFKSKDCFAIAFYSRGNFASAALPHICQIWMGFQNVPRHKWFSARTFIGFLRHVGPLRRRHVGRIDEALELYQDRKHGNEGAVAALRKFRADYAGAVCIGQEDDAWRCLNIDSYVAGTAPQLRIRYLGIWDTVGTLGIPEIVPGSDWFNREHDFYDASLDRFVESVRHAVAIDERRRLFPPVVLGDLAALNFEAGVPAADRKAPYQERWFPGVHGSVGGGGDIRGLSDDALAWVLAGAKAQGLQLDSAMGTRLHSFMPDPLAPLVNTAKPEFSMTGLIKNDREGPEHVWQVAESAQRRWRTPAARFGGKAPPPSAALVAVPLALRIPDGRVLSLLSTTTVFGTANDITLAELTLESFFPADEFTRKFFLDADAQSSMPKFQSL